MKLSKLSRMTPEGRKMPKGYRWDYWQDKKTGTVYTDSAAFAAMCRAAGFIVEYEP